MHTLVLGIGNTLLADEGVGVHAVHHLATYHDRLPDTEYLDGGTLSFTLAGPIEDADNLIVIDAAQLNAQPGTVRTFVGDDMDNFLNGQHKRSVHEVGLMDLMTIAKLADHLPRRRALIGIQPQKLDWGESPTEDVQAAIPQVCEKVVELIRKWHS
jgi:hydrogenase maturation protease